MSTSENGTPRWLEAIRNFERAIGVPVERFVTSETYFDLLPHLNRAQAQLEELAAAATDHWYRLMNFPSGTDVRQMREQMSRMERQIEKLTKQLADSEAARAKPPKRPASN